MSPDNAFPEPSKRREYIHGVFERVAERYDLMNDLMSLGLHRAWKQNFVEKIIPRGAISAKREILDMAAGSGDIALRCFERAGRKTSITLCDPNPEMLNIARKRIDAMPLEEDARARLRLLCAPAEKTPFAACSFDVYAVAFGIRNAACIETALEEAFRVLRPGGRFLCLEFSQPRLPGLEQAYSLYSEHVIPKLGEIVVGEREPYRYLVESIKRFPSPHRFNAMVEAAGFRHAKYRRLSGGIVTLHQAWRI
ncbi:MAG: class I SAM-dependent methyltransferase [Hyphomicrobiales bacterium]|nr:class I SAM-dependent methyltransferase [Hyphomicrobiales bacterium]